MLRSWEKDGAVLPAFPPMASRLIDALEHADVETATVEEIILQDASITSQVIRASNSVLYGKAVGAQDLHQAIMRIGFRETAGIAMLAASRSLFAMEDRAEFSCFPVLWQQLWESSMVCAFGASLLSRELELSDPSRTFLCATFRDIGCVLILKLLAAGLVRGRLRANPDDSELQLLFERHHARLGSDYLRGSHMPDYVTDVAERHHASDVPFAPDTTPLHLVRCADGLCEMIGVMPFADGKMSPSALESAAALKVEEARLDYLALQFEGIREQVRELMGGP